MGAWESFFVAVVGASAALAGLIFVGVSLNLGKILSFKGMAERGFEVLLLLLTTLIVSSLSLVPEQPAWVLGAEVLSVGLPVWLWILKIQIDYFRRLDPQYKGYFVGRVALSEISILPFLVSGIILLATGDAHTGVFWMVPGIIFSFFTAIVSAWVLLVEINH